MFCLRALIYMLYYDYTIINSICLRVDAYLHSLFSIPFKFWSYIYKHVAVTTYVSLLVYCSDISNKRPVSRHDAFQLRVSNPENLVVGQHLNQLPLQYKFLACSVAYKNNVGKEWIKKTSTRLNKHTNEETYKQIKWNNKGGNISLRTQRHLP